MKKLLPVLICIALLMCGCSAPDEIAAPAAEASASAADAVPTDTQTEPPAEPPTDAPTDPPTPQELAQIKLDSILLDDSRHADAGQVEVGEIFQYPDLPTGCEAVAATIAINRYGYQLSEIEFARDWLIRGDDIIRSFVGDPFEWGGAGIFPPGLCDSVRRYIDATGAQLAAFDVTGASVDTLYRFIDNGIPVVVWCTYYMTEPRIEYDFTYDGHTVYWYENEHCMCLYGYDTQRGTVMFSDPIQGKVTEDADAFESVYTRTGQMAMVILDTSQLTGQPKAPTAD